MRILLVVLAMCIAAPAWAGKILVLESEGVTGFAAGYTFDGSSEITVPAGARIVLMDEGGIAVTVKGPYKGIPGGTERAAGPTFLDRVAAILAASNASSHPVLGATRSPVGPPPLLPDVWALDVTRDGAACVRGSGDVVLWRPTPRPATSVAISRGIAGTPAQVSRQWPAAQATVPWPNEMPLADGTPYVVKLGDAPAARSLVIRKTDTVLDSDLATLDWLASAGCTPQAKILLTVMGQRRVVEGPLAKLFE